MPPEETPPGLVAASVDEAVVHHVHHHSPPPSSVIIGHHKRKRRNHDALPQEEELVPIGVPKHLPSTINADRGATKPAAPAGGAHRSQRHRRTPAADRATGAGGSSSKGEKISPSPVAPPPASIKAIRVKHSSSSSSFVISGGGKQHPVAGSGSHSSYANSHAAAAPSSSSSRLTIRVTGAPPPPPPPPHRPAKASRPPPSASVSPSAAAAAPLEPGDRDDECYRRGVEVFAGWDAATQQAAVDRFVRQQAPPEGGGFSFWLTPAEAEADLKYVHDMVEARRRAAASGSGEPRRH